MHTEIEDIFSGAMSVDAFAKWAGIGRTTAWLQIRSGNIRAIKVGRRTLIMMSAAREWLHSRPSDSDLEPDPDDPHPLHVWAI